MSLLKIKNYVIASICVGFVRLHEAISYVEHCDYKIVLPHVLSFII